MDTNNVIKMMYDRCGIRRKRLIRPFLAAPQRRSASFQINTRSSEVTIKNCAKKKKKKMYT